MAESSNTFVIQTQNLSKTYKEVVALKALDLEVPKHSIFGFLGPNGAGKTTTIKLLLGLTKPSLGSGSVFGFDIRRENIEIRSRVGYLPQNPTFYEGMSAREILEFKAKFYFKGPQEEIDRRVQETLELVGLADKADRPVKGFSGGERQRLGIAQAQVHYPDLLILDEPAASLDPLGRRDVLEVMRRLKKHATIFYCTHILDDVQRVSDTVAILNQGQLIAQGDIGTLLSGKDGLVYVIKSKGDSQRVQERISAQPWVSHLSVQEQDGTSIWSVSVSDPQAAERNLFRLLLADEDFIVTEFRQKEIELEEVFMEIIEGGKDVG
jgi:ABC-2 type transport system ATP-binding protein